MEITRDIAMRFNNLYSPTFTVPEAYIGEHGAKVFSLQQPGQKMSKSDPDPNAAVSIIEEPDSIMKKFQRAVTDSDTAVRYDPDNKPGVSNLMVIMSEMSGMSLDEIERVYGDKGYAAFKKACGEAVIERLKPVKAEYDRLMGDKEYLLTVAREGADRARRIARRTLQKVKRKIGLVEQ